MILIKNDALYDRLKFLAQIVLPAVATLYFTLAGIWGLPKADEVVGTIVAIDLFLGTILQLSSNAYDKSDEKYDGTINVVETDDTKTYSLEVKDSVDTIDEKEQLLFRVNPDL